MRDSEKTGLLILLEMKGSVRYDRISPGSWSMLLGFSLVVCQSTGENGGFFREVETTPSFSLQWFQ